MNIKTTNTILYCKQWQAVVDFYQHKLKFSITASCEWFVEFTVNEGSRISVADASKASIDSSDGQGITITFEVDDIEASYFSVTATGIHSTPIKNHAWGAKVFYIHDPEGNRIEFWSRSSE